MHNVVKLPGQVAGFLGSAHDPFQVDARPERPRLPARRAGTPRRHLARSARRSPVAAPLVDHQFERETGPPRSTSTAYSETAFRLLRSEAVRRAFRLDGEDPRLRDRYGRNKHGQSVILARRLVEAGVRFVTVYDD